ncbi:MAG: hemolysin III family protein [Candidatus Nanopelagicales bacterium]
MTRGPSRTRNLSPVDQAVDRAFDKADRRIGAVGEHVPESVRPKLRGWLHLGAVPLSILLGVVATVFAPAGAVRWSVLVYLVTTVLLFGVSATYHRRIWGARAEAVLKRLDHSNIYLFIAGSYTPFAVALFSGTQGDILLIIVWTVAVLGVLFRVMWVGAPRPLYVAMYIALGWAAVGYLPALWRSGGAAVAILILIGGLLYTLGAVVYTFRRPNTFPRWFGFHEIFHALTIAAYLAQYAAVLLVVTD